MDEIKALMKEKKDIIDMLKKLATGLDDESTRYWLLYKHESHESYHEGKSDAFDLATARVFALVEKLESEVV